MTMIEKVARALRRKWNIYHFDRDSDVGWEEEVDNAKAAIAAMREPTSDMILAAMEADGALVIDAIAPNFTAMIDAALAE